MSRRFLTAPAFPSMPTVDGLVDELPLPEAVGRDFAFRVAELPHRAIGTYGYNSRAFSQDNLTTFSNQQYVVFYDSDGKPRVLKRSLPTSGAYGGWLSGFDLSTVTGNPLGSPVEADEHNVIVIGISSNGILHIVADMHASALKYVRSTAAQSVAAFEAATMIGTEEAEVTYPVFFKLADGSLMFMYRDGTSGDGNLIMNKYNAGTATWSRVGVIIDGKESTPDRNPYPHRVVVDPVSGRVHLAWEWRDDPAATANHDLSYAYSDDGCVTWRKTNGSLYTLPITFAQADIIDPVPVTTGGLTNNGGACLDAQGRYHVIYEKNYSGGAGLRLWHMYLDGTTWTRVELPAVTSAAGRASAFATATGLVYTMYVSEWGNGRGRLSCMEITPGVAHREFPLLLIDLYKYEPAFDTVAYLARNELHMLVVPSSAAGAPEAGVADTWKQSWAAVVSLDLERIADVQRRESVVPTLAVVEAVQGEPSPVKVLHTSAEESAQGRLVIGREWRSHAIFARLRVRGVVGASTTLTLQLWEHLDPSTDTLLSKIEFTSTTEATKWTPWIRLPNLAAGDVEGFVGAKAYRTGANDAIIVASQIELGVLTNAI